jgi:hypothetical protein
MREEWNRPSRTDWYLMALRHEVATVLVSDKSRLRIEQMKLPFTFEDEKEEETVEERTAKSKAAWLGALNRGTLKVIVKTLEE